MFKTGTAGSDGTFVQLLLDSTHDLVDNVKRLGRGRLLRALLDLSILDEVGNSSDGLEVEVCSGSVYKVKLKMSLVVVESLVLKLLLLVADGAVVAWEAIILCVNSLLMTFPVF